MRPLLCRSMSCSALFLLLLKIKDTAFVMTNDGKFLEKTIEEYLQNHEVHKVPLMTGVTNNEFGWLLPNVSHP